MAAGTPEICRGMRVADSNGRCLQNIDKARVKIKINRFIQELFHEIGAPGA